MLQSHSIPRNQNRLIDIKQSVTLTGLGSDHFHTAVRGVGAAYQAFKMHLASQGCQLRAWAPGSDGGNSLTLTFSNRILSSAREAEGEREYPLREVVDPFNILRPSHQAGGSHGGESRRVLDPYCSPEGGPGLSVRFLGCV